MDLRIEACRSCIAAQPKDQQVCELEKIANPVIARIEAGTIFSSELRGSLSQMAAAGTSNDCPRVEKERFMKPIHKVLHPDRPYRGEGNAKQTPSVFGEYLTERMFRTNAPEKL